MAQACSGAELLEVLRRRQLLRPAAELDADEPAYLPTGLAALDRLCGGFPRGRLSEVVTGAGGGAGVLHATLAAAGSRGWSCALLDPADGFDVASAAAAGVGLDSLLWVRPGGLHEALRCAEWILETGGFELLVLDDGDPRHRAPGEAVPSAAWLRLGRLARRAKAVLLVMTAQPRVGPFAALGVDVVACRGRWGGRGERWLAGVDLTFRLRKRRHGA